jgi:hypothetical protein
MPKLYTVYREIDETVAEYDVVSAAVVRYRGDVHAANADLPEGTQPHHLDRAVEQLEGTYLIRLWAVFETAWASYWRHRTNRPDGKIKAFDLVEWGRTIEDGYKSIGTAVTPDVHRVRDYRNLLVHARDQPAPPVPIGEARSYLNRYLAKLPNQWPAAGDDE